MALPRLPTRRLTDIGRSGWSKGGGDRLQGQVADLAGGGRQAGTAGGLQAIEKEEFAWRLNGAAVALDKVAKFDPGRWAWFGRRTK